VELTVLGSGTAAPNPRRGAPGYLLRAGEERLLLECGAGTVDRLLRAGADPRRLDRVVITHHHPDHIGEMAHLLFSYRRPVHGRRLPLTVAGSAPLLDVLARLGEVYGRWVQPREYTLDFHDLDAAPLVGRGYGLLGYPVDHIDSSRAIRIEEEAGGVLAFSGDTDVCEGLVSAARGADLLVAEASFPEGFKKEGHLVPSEAGRLARQAGARRLLLSHFYPECDEKDPIPPARSEFSGEILVAEDGMSVVVNSAPGGRF
jgi:ribonuclease BN (tRNA processing enzyme)